MPAISYDTKFGTGWVIFDGATVVETVLPGGAIPDAPIPDDRGEPNAVLQLCQSLTEYFDHGTPIDASFRNIAQATTPFRRKVYEVVTSIPPGSTLTYAEVAARVGRPGAARAVGAAMAANRLAPLMPCHRVVGRNGDLRGYAGGVEMKRRLLDAERRHE